MLENEIKKKIQLDNPPPKKKKECGLNTKQKNKGVIDSRVKLKILKQFTKEIKIKTQNQKKTDQI
jgi:hypothetical protein